ncbi:hypothetical protein FYK55_17680 [Roseiconus nitratireducens]|uniref:Uncharacterized protein n=1 Tax=Roseiconus nitratireducens TaxID=2605748 RepID=A0A5M6D6F4_9BACT|nr:hypothetical protein [Roseiconus nitratireducens]KAA5541399.1 hypothetical protein FYK55_17680 [Roseiconus nitratireducens]
MKPFSKFRNVISLVLLAICTLPGQRFVVHSHETVAGAPEVLQAHLDLYHPARGEKQETPSCPHCHWVVIGDAFHRGEAFPAVDFHPSVWKSNDSGAEAALTLQQAVVWLDRGKDCSRQSIVQRDNDRSLPTPSAKTQRSRLCVWNC